MAEQLIVKNVTLKIKIAWKMLVKGTATLQSSFGA